MYFNFEKLPNHLRISPNRAKRIFDLKVKKLKDYFRKANFKKGIVGVSGGLDSSLAAVLGERALGKENLYLVRMPYSGISPEESLANAQALAKNLNLPSGNFLTLSLNNLVDSEWEVLKRHRGGKENLRKGNLMARERMKILFDLSSAFRAIVIGTENRTEKELGYFTLWGDQASGVEPILDLWKTQIFQIAQNLEQIPGKVLDISPSAELWPGQTDEKEMGASLTTIDTILSAKEELKMSEKEISKKFDISLKTIKAVLKLSEKGEIKNKLPYSLEIRT